MDENYLDFSNELDDSAGECAESIEACEVEPLTHTGSGASQYLNYLHAAAHEYHALGLPITLCRGKAPFQSNWPKLSWNARRIDEVYRLNGAANVGLILGPRSGLVDFECDGPEAEETFLELFQGELVETPTWRSQRGQHRLFQWQPALGQLGKNKLVLGDDGAALEILLGPAVQTLLPPSFCGVKREWVAGRELFPHHVAAIPEQVLLSLGCDLGASHDLAGSYALAGADSAALSTDSNPSSVVSVLSVVSVVSVLNISETTARQLVSTLLRCLVTSPATTNQQFMALAIGLKNLPELAERMGEDFQPIIRCWYEQSVANMKEKAWQGVWERWLYLWVWAEPGHDKVRQAFESALQTPLPECALDYPILPMQQLVGLCQALGRDHADEHGVWFLSCRSAGAVLGIQHTFAAKLLKMLVRDGVLELVDAGTKKRAARYRYLADK